jgi:hypothetical protein
MTNTSCCVYSIKTPDDGQQICPKHLEFFTKIKLRNSASRRLLLQEEEWKIYLFLKYIPMIYLNYITNTVIVSEI